MNEQEVPHYVFSFECEEPGCTTTVAFSLPQDAQWSEVVRHFADFLSCIYGYRMDALDEAAR